MNRLKEKTAKKVLALLRWDRHKRIRKSICSTKNKSEFGAGSVSFCRQRRQYIYDTKKDKLHLYSPVPVGEGTQQPGVEPGHKGETRAKKKKYKIYSYLFNVVCKFPRKYLVSPGEEIFRTYYTIPYKSFSYTRFLAGTLLKLHYRNLSSWALKRIARRARLARGGQDRSNQVGKKFIHGLEERLDSSVVRLLEFKPRTSMKQASPKKSKELQATKKFLYKRPKFSQYTVKLPLANWGPLHAKQLINHGHIKVNGITVKSVGFKIDPLYHQIEYRQPFPVTPNQTMLLRRFKDVSPADTSTNPEQAPSKDVVDFVRRTKVKRWTEIFFMTYRNLHWIQRDPGGPDVEKHILPVIRSIGFNQSIYTSSSLSSLLAATPWGPSVKRNLLLFGSTSSQRSPAHKAREEKTRLQGLLRWKRLWPTTRSTGLLDQLVSWMAPGGHEGKGDTYIKNAQKAISTSQCYALIVYGTRTCKWVKLQQPQRSFYKNQIYKKTHFLEVELELLQWIHQAYDSR